MEDRPSSFLTTPLAILLGSFVIGVCLLISGGVIKFGPPQTVPVAAQPQAAQPQAPQATEQTTEPIKISLDDDPVLGDKNAPVTLVEFSDYECPYCKRHFDQTYSQIKKDYIDTGKVKLVFRDLPLPFHEPMATTEAIAANCAREQGGDTTYFKYHDELFTRTKSNGNGLAKDDLYKISTDLGLNTNNLKICVAAEKYKEEVQKDLTEANNAGAGGTPTFFLGKSSTDNQITTGKIDPTSQAFIFKTTSGGKLAGVAMVGAQPYSQFKTLIDELLK